MGTNYKSLVDWKYSCSDWLCTFMVKRNMKYSDLEPKQSLPKLCLTSECDEVSFPPPPPIFTTCHFKGLPLPVRVATLRPHNWISPLNNQERQPKTNICNDSHRKWFGITQVMTKRFFCCLSCEVHDYGVWERGRDLGRQAATQHKAKASCIPLIKANRQ